MAKITNPLFSETATGTFGGAITFRCGHYVTKAQKEKPQKFTEEQNAQREKFQEAVAAWHSHLENPGREAWQNFARRVSDPRGYYKISIPGFILLVPIGFKSGFQKCIEMSRYSGYHYFISAYLRFGAGGWLGYPYPPDIE